MNPDDLTLSEYSQSLIRLQKEVAYWKEQCRQLTDENEKLALDLGLRDYPQLRESTKGD